jgi:hypothetical protein
LAANTGRQREVRNAESEFGLGYAEKKSLEHRKKL